MKGDPNLQEMSENVTKIRQYAAITHVCSSLAQNIGKSSTIKFRMDETTLKPGDLDELRTKDICEALKMELDVEIVSLAVETIRRAYRST